MGNVARIRGGGLAALTILLSACWGCDGGGGTPSVSSSTEPATVHGTVRIKGKVATGGKVSFDPSNVSRKEAAVASAEIGKDGTYTVKTLVGENNVHVDSPEVNKDQKLQYTTLKFDAKGGDNSFDIELPPPGQ